MKQTKSDILYIYSAKDCNPNGDPNDDNKPRMDEENKINLVTDVRLKRIVRDYINVLFPDNILISEQRERRFVPIKEKPNSKKQKEEENKEEKKKEKKEEKGNWENVLLTKEERQNALLATDKESMIKQFIDIRLFGATNAIKGNTFNLNGPVQFSTFGRSYNKVNVRFNKGTATMPSKKNTEAGTFTTFYTIPFSVIGFYGSINTRCTKLCQTTNDDIDLLYEALWNGTKDMHSRSKFNHKPLLLIEVEYKKGKYQIGDLRKYVKVTSKKKYEEDCTEIEDFTFDISRLIQKLDRYADDIERIRLKVDDDMDEELFNYIKSSKFKFDK